MARVKCPKCFHVNADGETLCIRCGAALPRIRIDAQPGTPRGSESAGEPTELQFQRGQIINDRYSVLSQIGRGGMGAIYKVHDNVLGETVALKTLLPQFVKDKMVVERFFNEAKIARRLAHPNIVRVHDIGKAGNSVYISMEYVQGISLRSMLEGMPAGQRLPLRKVMAVVDALCAALEYAHQYTIHRDIKPENVMVTAEGVVKLMDFGISKLMSDTRMTAPSVVMGTPFYMSPEQLKNSRDVDARADIYSVGVLLYETLTGNVPTGVPKPASQISSEVPPALDAVILKCVAVDPRERYATATELRAALRPVIELLDAGGDLKRLTQASPKAERGEVPWRKVAGWILLASLGAGAVFGLFRVEEQRKAAASAGLGAETPAGSVAETVVTGGALSWEEFSALVEEVKRVAVGKSGANAEMAQVYRRGDDLWQKIQSKGGISSDTDATMARHALQYYLATLMSAQTTDMAFVPACQVAAGEKTVAVDPFFIDRHEAGVTSWRQFCTASQGQWPACLMPAQGDVEGLPVAGVRYFEAEAFAAAQGKLLPTSAQWSAAAFGALQTSSTFPWGEEALPDGANLETGVLAPSGSYENDLTATGVRDMAGNLAEWTRTRADGKPGSPELGVRALVRGGSYAAPPVPLAQSAELDFYTALPSVGFRCVLEIPTDPAAIRDLVRRVS